MTTLELAYRNYDESRSEDTQELKAAFDYLTKGASIQRSDTVIKCLVAAVDAESRLAFLAGVRAATNLLTGGYDDE